MECIERRIGGVFEIILKTFEDARGFFMRSYDAKIFEEVGIERRWVQENHSLSLKQGTLRGLHFQFPPHCEAKLVRVIKGAILDVVLDLRKESETFGQWDFLELSSENKKLLFIPRGFAHGFCTLTDGCEVVYKVDNFYNSDAEWGILWNDPTLGITWPVESPILSKKDSQLRSFEYFVQEYGGIALL